VDELEPLNAVKRSSRKLCKALNTCAADGVALLEDDEDADVAPDAVVLALVLLAVLAGVELDVVVVVVLAGVPLEEAGDVELADEPLGTRPDWLNAWKTASMSPFRPSPWFCDCDVQRPPSSSPSLSWCDETVWLPCVLLTLVVEDPPVVLPVEP
jgi:hypothetical protein